MTRKRRAFDYEAYAEAFAERLAARDSDEDEERAQRCELPLSTMANSRIMGHLCFLLEIDSEISGAGFARLAAHVDAVELMLSERVKP